MFANILLCTHGSEGARRAEQYVFSTLMVAEPQPRLTILTVIDKDWSVMTGDDWLNTSTTRNTFIDYVEEQLGREIAADWQRIKTTYQAADQARFLRVVGGIEETIAETAASIGCDLIVCGCYTKKPFRLGTVKMAPGLAARIANDKLHPLLPCPLLTAR